MHFGENVSYYRKQLGLTQDELAEKMFVSRQTISRWETGTYLPPVEMLQLLSQRYGLTINELLQGERIAPENQLAAANQTIAQVMKDSPFLFKERQAYWQKKWTQDHRFDVILLIILSLVVQVLSIVFGKPDWATAGTILTLAGVMLLNNRKAEYVEHHLYNENLPQD